MLYGVTIKDDTGVEVELAFPSKTKQLQAVISLMRIGYSYDDIVMKEGD